MIALFLVSLVLLQTISPLRGAIIVASSVSHCEDNSECPTGSCCVIGGYKYSVPQCKPMLSLGDTCRPNYNDTLSTTLYYPDGSQINLNNVYYILCPCASGSCDPREGMCI